MEIKDEIRLIRKALDLTQEKFADLIGTKLKTLAGWESGRHFPRADQYKKILSFKDKAKENLDQI